MRRLLGYLAGVDSLPQDIAWVMVDRLYRDTASLMAGTVALMAFGIVGYVESGSRWYLALVAYITVVFAWRWRQRADYHRSAHSGTPREWALRSLITAWAAGAGWGAATAVILYEPRHAMTTCLIGMHAGLVSGGSVRNAAVRPIAVGQNLLASGPLFLACAASGNVVLQVYSAMVLMHMVSGLTVSRALRLQTLDLLMQKRETSELVERLAAANQELAAVNRRLETLAGTDALTNLANRRAFDVTLAREWRWAQRQRTALSLLLVDVDHFKAFNDLYGHQAGDACLRDVAAAITSAVHRPGDVPARYGGEEFAVILPNTDLDGALGIAEDIRRRVAQRARPHTASVCSHVTVSVGVGFVVPDPDMSIEDLIGCTDAALYAAKHGGRNCVYAAPDITRKPVVAQRTL